MNGIDKEMNKLNKLNKLVLKYREERAKWLRQILLFATMLFGFLISLFSIKNNFLSATHQIPLSISVCILGLGILFGGIALYADTSFAKQIFQKKKESLNANQRAAYVSEPRIYEFARKICYTLLASSLLGFISYVIIITFF